ncbi:unnamed protein product (macronuclear) [Paramecium tetraurelia]|uniref:RING-type domain-containing protein n=1 Tax=Paramecium tetraurelia TaxID=5888 RepID=A0C9C5_PARTE|nr:uncharacterized protein GSPATT00006698001 [Paramecium tetraurelia]CAK67392.1 unnamed protein product [Paramecium tetraurelia]|eukprot:XP_001434789.1 hypothetical protein (macronuclear) [Paramecium tetraurelia strain d4-2]
MDVKGLQLFAINGIFYKQLSDKQKVTITLTYQEGEFPILLICDDKPQDDKINDYNSIQKENCKIDINAYDQKVEMQTLSLTKKEKSQTFQANFNVYYMDNSNIFIGAYSEHQSTFNISSKISSLYNCAKECKNRGRCANGVCECQEGTFGDDCSVVGVNIKDQIKLSPNTLYYQDLYSTGTSFQRTISNSIPIRQQCYVEMPFFDEGSLIITNTLEISNEKIEECKNLTQALENESQIKLNSYIIFKIYSEFDVSIISNDGKGDGLSKIMMMIFIPVFVLIFFLLVCCGVKFYKRKLDETQVPIKVEQQNEEKNFINLYIPTHKFEQVTELIQEEVNIKDLYCSICLDAFSSEHDVKITYCKHIYHSECLTLWIQKTKVILINIQICPLCRAPLDEKTLAQLINQRSETMIDQILTKIQPDSKQIKIFTLNSLSSLNGPNTQQAFQNLNYQRSLVFVEQ